MQRIYFTKEEADTHIGLRIKSLMDFPSVPKGSEGIIIKALPLSKSEWVVKVRWDLPRKSSMIYAMIGDISLHFSRKSKAITDEFSKSEFESLVKIVQH